MRVLDEIVVRVIPQDFPGAPTRCRVVVKVSGKIEHGFEMTVPEDDFESRFHRFMHIAEERIVRIAKKESEEDDAANERKEIPSP